MMKRRGLALAVLAVAGCTRGGSQPAVGRPRLDGLVAEQTLGKDVTAEVRSWNSAAFAAPATSFRAGSAHPRQLDTAALTKVGSGFSIKLPSGAPVLSPAVYGGLVITPGGFHSRELYAFEASTGKLAWAIDLDDDGPSAPACEDGVCVINTESCTLFAVEARTGKLLWSWWLGDPLMSSPTIAGGKVFTAYPAGVGVVGGQNQNLNNANGMNGSWGNVTPSVPVPPQPASGASATREVVGVARPRPPGQSHAMAAFDLHTGKLLWQRWIDADVMSAPVAAGGELYATSFAGTVYRFDPASGDIKSARRARATSAPVVVGGQVYFSQRAEGSAEESLVAQDARSAKAYWSAERRAAPYLAREVQARSSLASKGAQLDSANGFSGGAPASANAEVAALLIGQANVSTLQSFQGSRMLSFRGANITTMGDEVVATDGRTGQRRWAYKLSGDAAKSGGHLGPPPLAAGNKILVATLEGEIQVVNPKTGKVERRFAVGSPIRSQPVVSHGWIYVGTEDGKLVAIDTGDKSLTGWPMWGKNAAREGAI